MINIGLGEYAVSSEKDETLITHALGTCVALILYCPYTKRAAMAHIVLPKRDKRHNRNKDRAAYFAADIVPHLMSQFLDNKACIKQHLKVTLVGGCTARNKDDYFKVGEQNVATVKKLLSHLDMKHDDKETLGRFSRTVRVDVNTGDIKIRKQQMLL